MAPPGFSTDKIHGLPKTTPPGFESKISSQKPSEKVDEIIKRWIGDLKNHERSRKEKMCRKEENEMERNINKDTIGERETR